MNIETLLALADEYALADWDSVVIPPIARAALHTALVNVVKDAERYQWLRKASNTTPCYAPTPSSQPGAGWQVRYEWYGDRHKPTVVYQSVELDSAIDAEMKAVK